MSTNTLQSLSRRAGGNFSSINALSHTRAASSRRICLSSPKTYSALSSRQDRDRVSSSSALLSSRFTPNTVALPITSQRHVSFKEMREERARQRRGESQPAPKDEKKKAEPTKAAKTEEVKSESAEETPAAEQYTSSEADAVFARMKAASEAEWARIEEAERRAQEKADSEGAEKTEGAEGAEGAEDKQKQQKKKKEQEEPAEAPHGNKSPWQVFTETLSTEFKASKEWNESTKELSGSIHDFTQNPNVQKARSAYTKAAEGVSSTTGKVVMGTAGAIGKGAAWTWDTPVVKGLRYGAAAVGSGVEKVTRPVRETEAYKNVKEVVDDGSSQRYGGWTEREERKKRRAERDLKQGYKPQEVHEEDPDAGTNVTVHKDSVWKESWKNFTENNSTMQRLFRMGGVYRESENPLISTARSVSDRIAGFFAENETAQVIKKFREMDPSFQLEPFLNEMRGYILPEVLEAYVKGDVETLKLWLSAAQFQVYHALMQQYTTAGLKSDGQIVDIRNVDILSARMLEPGEIPVFVLMCRTQEVHVYRNAKSGELAAGMEDKVQQVTYAIGVTRIPEEVSNPETRGWRLIELQKSARDYM